MKRLVILGAGTAGTMVANRLSHELNPQEWLITVVDQQTSHYYQPGFLFIPFGIYEPADVVKPTTQFLPYTADFIKAPIQRVDPEQQLVYLENVEQPLAYDYLIIATGTSPRPEQTPGLTEEAWRKTIHDFYTYEGAVALGEVLPRWSGGRLVVSIMEYPFKCPVAPLEFIFLADGYFTEKGIRDQVEITLVTPLSGAFTKPIAEKRLSSLLQERNIKVVTDFSTERVDPAEQCLISYDEQVVPYDLLVTVPVNMGADFIGRSGLGDELNHVPVDKHTFVHKKYPTIFALGDAAQLPTSKAGSVAHFAVDVFIENFRNHINGRPMNHPFDGHANCFIESGFGKGILIDFNYDTEPLPGAYPLPGIGPFSLLEESRLNHLGKLAFRWVYWNMLLPGRELPVPTDMSLTGKQTDLLPQHTP